MKPTPQDRIDKANADLRAAKEEQLNCPHQWSVPMTEGRTRKVGYGSVQDGAGSDPHWSYAGYMDEPYSVWVRTCLCCGLKQETEHTEPVVTSHRPVFPS